jgi:hypothetical protein
MKDFKKWLAISIFYALWLGYSLTGIFWLYCVWYTSGKDFGCITSAIGSTIVSGVCTYRYLRIKEEIWLDDQLNR